jgi:N-acetylmuramic acid 6-phosphate etherase
MLDWMPGLTSTMPPLSRQCNETFRISGPDFPNPKGLQLRTRRPSALHTPLVRLRTEQSNAAALDLDQKSSLEIARIINREDATVSAAVARALPQIARAIDLVVAALRRGGRLIYVGSGTSGRLAALDALECPPTFNTEPGTVQFVIAGGEKALASASEGREDDSSAGRKDMGRRKPTKKDVVLGIAASGRTPFTVAAVSEARRRGAQTIALTCNPNSPLECAAHFAIVTQVGPEVLAGSSRMKAGTAHKMVLNMISTAAMTRLGYVYGNLMVNVAPKNEKLVQRAVGILERATGASQESARSALKSSRDRTPVALVILAAGVSPRRALAALAEAKGNVRKAIAIAERE